jgi:hypothetical protein
VGEIIRSINGVDNPPKAFGSPRGLLEDFTFTAFLSDEAMVGVGFLDSVNDYLLASGVGLGY